MIQRILRLKPNKASQVSQWTTRHLRTAACHSAQQPSLAMFKYTMLKQPWRHEICFPRHQHLFSTSPASSSSATASGSTSSGPTTSDALKAPDHLNDKERHIFTKLVCELEPGKLEVQDVSGGCGSMYAIDISSRKFKGLNLLKQQRLVYKVLEEEMKGWHGLQLSTRAE